MAAAACSAAHALDPAVSAGGYLVRQWQSDTGLPSDDVRSVIQSREGYIWIAAGGTITRFDGHRFHVFDDSTAPELLPRQVYAIHQSADGTIWAAGNGLFAWDGWQFKRFTTADGLPQIHGRSFGVKNDGTIAVGTHAGMAFLRNGRVEPADEIWKQTNGVVRAYVQTNDGTELLGTERGLWRRRGQTLDRLSRTSAFTRMSYTALAEAPDGAVWIGASIGLHRLLPDGRVETFSTKEGLDQPRVQAIHVDRNGDVWIGVHGGLYRYRNGTIERADYPETIGTSTVYAFCEDRDGGLWLGTSSGLFQLTDPIFSAIGPAKGLQQTRTTTVYETKDGRWLIGTWGGGPFVLSGGTIEPLPVAQNEQINAFHEETDGTIWIGTTAGLFRYRKDAAEVLYLRSTIDDLARRLKTDDPLVFDRVAHPHINAIIGDRTGGLWIGTVGALYHYRDDRFHLVSGRTALADRDFRSLALSRDGTLWCATDQGTASWRQGQWTHYSDAGGLQADGLRKIYIDSRDHIWVITDSGGIFRQNERSYRAYGRRDGLPDNNVAGLIEDDLGFFWIGTAQGVMRVPLTDFDELDAGKISHLRGQVYTKRHGLPMSEVAYKGSPNLCKLADGRIVFPTSKGLGVVNSRKADRPHFPAPVHIERMLVSGSLMNVTTAASLPPDHTDVEFQFTAVELLSPEKVRFKVRLSPVDHDWHETENLRSARYPRLPYGNYRLEVIAANADGVWSTQPATVAFSVQPFFYQTLWFRLACGLGAAGLMVSLYRLRVRQIHERAAALAEQNRELEKRVSERTAELAKSYEVLRASEYFYHSLVESLPQFIVRKDADSRFTYANSAFAEMHNKTLNDIIGKTDREFYSPEQAEKYRADDLKIMASGQTMEYENVFERNGTRRYLHVKKVPLYDQNRKPMGVQVLFWDMTVFRETEEKLKHAQRDLIEVSRLAGIAEVATSVLHNLGNALNSVNTAAAVAHERLREQKTPNLKRVAQMMLEQKDRIAEFMSSDPRGAQLPSYLDKLADTLAADRDSTLKEIESLQQHIHTVKQIVAAQQEHAKITSISEAMPPAELMEYALRVSEASLERHGVLVSRAYTDVPPVKVERQKALQILVSLIRNAEESLQQRQDGAKHLSLVLGLTPQNRVQLQVIDNGVGIAPENLTRIFGFGFSTKPHGHGFSLHTGILAAKELGGSLTAQSEGVGKGATFTLELPAA